MTVASLVTHDWIVPEKPLRSWVVFRAVWEHEPVTCAELERVLGDLHQTVSSRLSDLMDMGLVYPLAPADIVDGAPKHSNYWVTTLGYDLITQNPPPVIYDTVCRMQKALTDLQHERAAAMAAEKARWKREMTAACRSIAQEKIR